jgi:hypothetical protein
LPLWIGLVGRFVGKGYAYRVANSSVDVWPWVSLLLLAAFTAVQVLWDEDDVINYLPVVLLICVVILVVDRLCGCRSSCCCAPQERRAHPHPHLAHVLLTQFAIIFGPHYLAKSSFKLITDAEQRLDVFSNVFEENDTREMAEKFTFYIVYLCLSSFLMLVVDVLAEWIMPNNTVLVKRLQLVVAFTEYLFIQAIIPSVTPIGKVFFAFLVFTFVKEIVLRTASHIRLFMWIYEWMTRYSCMEKIATCLHISDLKDMMSDMTQTESMVELFFVNELKSFSANAAGWVVLSSMMIELLGNYIRSGTAQCDDVFFFLTAANTQDVPRMIANNVFIMIAIGLAQMVTIMVWEARFEASKLQILDARIKKVYSTMAHKISERETRKNMRRAPGRMGGSTRGEGKGGEEMAGMARHLSSPAGLRTGGPARWGGGGDPGDPVIPDVDLGSSDEDSSEDEDMLAGEEVRVVPRTQSDLQRQSVSRAERLASKKSSKDQRTSDFASLGTMRLGARQSVDGCSHEMGAIKAAAAAAVAGVAARDGRGGDARPSRSASIAVKRNAVADKFAVEDELSTLYKAWSFDRARTTFWDLHKWISIILMVRVVVTVLTLAMNMIAKKKLRYNFGQARMAGTTWAKVDLWNCAAMWEGIPEHTKLGETNFTLIYQNKTGCV